MKSVFSLLVLSLIYLSLYAQKHDYVWQLGGNGNPPHGTYQIDFNANPISINTNNRNMSINYLSLSMCDVTGNYLFSSNGIDIADATGNLMQNGMGLNSPAYANAWVSVGSTAVYSAVILPLPTSSSEYYLFQEYLEWNPYYASGLVYSKIDMNLNNGLGAVTDKNVFVLQDSLEYYCVSAVKHGNGRDWWVCVPKIGGQYMYVILLTPDGITKVEKQKIQDIVRPVCIHSCFTPDGSTYIESVADKVRIMSFNRCTGTFGIPQFIDIIPFNMNTTTGSLCISPNSRILYRFSGDSIWQYDLWSSNPFATKTLAGIKDGFIDPYTQYPVTFGMSPQIAPDGKMYIASAAPFYHVIEHPDSFGTACNLIQNLPLPYIVMQAFPHFPNYRLVAAIGSGCDTLSVSNQVAVSSKQVKVYPNPARDRLQLESSEVLQKGTFVLYNLAGQAMLRQEVFGNAAEIKVEDMAAGMYFYRIFEGNKVIAYGKVVIE